MSHAWCPRGRSTPAPRPGRAGLGDDERGGHDREVDRDGPIAARRSYSANIGAVRRRRSRSHSARPSGPVVAGPTGSRAPGCRPPPRGAAPPSPGGCGSDPSAPGRTRARPPPFARGASGPSRSAAPHPQGRRSSGGPPVRPPPPVTTRATSLAAPSDATVAGPRRAASAPSTERRCRPPCAAGSRARRRSWRGARGTVASGCSGRNRTIRRARAPRLRAPAPAARRRRPRGPSSTSRSACPPPPPSTTSSPCLTPMLPACTTSAGRRGRAPGGRLARPRRAAGRTGRGRPSPGRAPPSRRACPWPRSGSASPGSAWTPAPRAGRPAAPPRRAADQPAGAEHAEVDRGVGLEIRDVEDVRDAPAALQQHRAQRQAKRRRHGHQEVGTPPGEAPGARPTPRTTPRGSSAAAWSLAAARRATSGRSDALPRLRRHEPPP